MPRDGKLNSWKEIAAYLGRDVRTVLRWEKGRKLPVRCIPGGKKRRVFAYRAEIDAWLDGSRSAREPANARELVLQQIAPVRISRRMEA